MAPPNGYLSRTFYEYDMRPLLYYKPVYFIHLRSLPAFSPSPSLPLLLPGSAEASEVSRSAAANSKKTGDMNEGFFIASNLDGLIGRRRLRVEVSRVEEGRIGNGKWFKAPWFDMKESDYRNPVSKFIMKQK